MRSFVFPHRCSALVQRRARFVSAYACAPVHRYYGSRKMLGRRWLERAFPRIRRTVLEPIGTVVETARAIRTRTQITVVQQRAEVHRRFPLPIAVQPCPRVIAVITHVVSPERPRAESVERLAQTIDGLLESLAQACIEVVVNSFPGRHIVPSLPEYQRARTTVRELPEAEPMYLGYLAQDEFASRIDEAEWFLYLEDDLVMTDGLVLEKLAYFNDRTPDDAVLMPNRYEMWQGRKVYIDNMPWKPGDLAWNRLTLVNIEGWKFAEVENPHSGCYYLSQSQLRRWVRTGRRWYGLESFSGPREAAATGCLQECFRLYKPHPGNPGFLEVRHLGTKYSEFLSTIHDLGEPDD
jgi:hypothetical protein